MQFVLNQFPRNSRHVSRLSCEDVPIFLEKFDEREFLFVVQIIAYVSNLGRLLHGQRDYFAEQVLWLDAHLGGIGLRHDRVWGGLIQGLLQVLEFYGRCESINHLAALPVAVIGTLDICSDGDDTMRP
jgi:hypothetical protein